MSETPPSLHPLYEVWRSIKRRCYDKTNKDYAHYGARGIKMYPPWRDDYMEFYTWSLSHGYKHGLTIDRVCNNRGYFPGNCRWVSRRAQANNRGTNTRVTIEGETHTIAQWARIKGIKDNTIIERIRRGMDPVEAILKPARQYNWKK